jgi:endonuclease YncB( thermonuclease family)
MLTRWQRWQISRAPAGRKRTFKGLTLWARVVRVYDGDTVTVVARHPTDKVAYDYSVRLAGIDTPELRVGASDANRELHKRAGQVARDRLQEKIPAGTMVIFEGTGEDKYSGRLLGKLYLPAKGFFGRRTDISQWMLKEGLAVSYSGEAKAGFRASMLRRVVGQASVV